jgi:hypothetical protein
LWELCHCVSKRYRFGMFQWVVRIFTSVFKRLIQKQYSIPLQTFCSHTVSINKLYHYHLFLRSNQTTYISTLDTELTNFHNRAKKE